MWVPRVLFLLVVVSLRRESSGEPNKGVPPGDEDQAEVPIQLGNATGLYFQEVGQIAGSIGYGHLVLDVNLTTIQSLIEHLCKQIEVLEDPDSLRDKFSETRDRTRGRVLPITRQILKRQLQRECHGLLADFYQHRQVWLASSSMTGDAGGVIFAPGVTAKEQWDKYHDRR